MDPVKTFERKLGQTNGVITSDMWPSGLVDIDNICKIKNRSRSSGTF